MVARYDVSVSGHRDQLAGIEGRSVHHDNVHRDVYILLIFGCAAAAYHYIVYFTWIERF